MKVSGADFGNVVSRDGTRIGYCKIGKGTGIVLVQGAMGTAANYVQLAEALATDFTVYIPDRRGRGMSPRAYSTGHRIDRDVEDVEAVCAAGGTQYLFGLSSGAIIALVAACALPNVAKIAVYEPPFSTSGLPPEKVLRFGQEIETGDLASALATAGEIVKLSPVPMSLLPRWIRRIVTQKVLNREASKGTGPYAPLTELLPAMRYDFDVVEAMAKRLTSFSDLQKPLLMLSGTRSPGYLQEAAKVLTAALPDARHAVLPGLDHSGPWNIDLGGRPSAVADVLRMFFC